MPIINPEILNLLKVFNINESDGLLCLLSEFFELEDNSRIPEEIHKQVNLTKIIERNYSDRGSLIWNVPLFVDANAEPDAWKWLQEWRSMFGKIRPDAIGSKSAVEKKMKAFFAANPEVRKEDIIESTKLYLNRFPGMENPKYLQKADYYISKVEKGAGQAVAQSRLEQYLEVYKNQQQERTVTGSRQMSQLVR